MTDPATALLAIAVIVMALLWRAERIERLRLEGVIWRLQRSVWGRWDGQQPAHPRKLTAPSLDNPEDAIPESELRAMWGDR